MKASIEWLKDYSDIDVSTKELADILTMTGSKVETIEEKGEDIKNVVVGKILEIEKHPNADRLVVTKIDIGNGEKLQIVTGADNIKVNDIVPIAKDGAELPGGKKIKTGKLRDVDSQGMMCSVGELGLDIENYPGQIEHGIMILDNKYEKNLGEDITEVLKLKESVLDFEITCNRPDCFSIEGLGREVAVSLDKKFKNPHRNIDELKIGNKNSIEGLTVNIEEPNLCYRYIARVVKNVKVKQSPEWLVKRLNACGIRAINNIVDITNYVMLEMGQPLHAFDINSIAGKQITVRRAKADEKIVTLDGVERTLNNDMLVIADKDKPVAIAGVMGGENSEIEADSNTVIFESAVFYGGSVRKTAKAVGLRTEASSRYEKGLSPENTFRAINRAIELVELLEAGDPVDGMIDVYPTKQKINKIKLDVNRINNLLGINLSKEDMIKILEKLEIKVENDVIIPPYFRTDIEQLADVAEEILRIYGYDKLETTLINAETTLGGKNKEQTIKDNVSEYLEAKGFSEIYTYGFISEKDLIKCNIDKEDNLFKQTVKIKNPLSEDYTIMKTTPIPTLLQVLQSNNNYKNKNVKVFELAKTYKNVSEKIEKGELPEENTVLTIGMYGEKEDFYTLKGVVENVLEVAGVKKYDLFKDEENKLYHPGRCASLKVGNDIFASLGELHPLVAENYNLNDRVLIAEINIDKIVKYARFNKKYVEIPKYPAVERDIAMVVDEAVEVGQIERIITKKAKKMLEEINLFDVYRNEKLGENKKSVAYSLKFRLSDRTLTDEEVNSTMQEIITALEKELNAELRK